MITLLCFIGGSNISESLLKDIDNLLSQNKSKIRDGDYMALLCEIFKLLFD